MHQSKQSLLIRLAIVLVFATVSFTVGAEIVTPLVPSCPVTPSDEELIYCPDDSNEFVSCTHSQCEETDDPSIVRCPCTKTAGPSVGVTGMGGCTKMNSSGELLSLFPGVPAVGVCTDENRAWALCLGVYCTPASSDPDENTYHCSCPVTRSECEFSKQFVVTAGPSACTSGVWSSATLGLLFSSSVFLRDNSDETTIDDPLVLFTYEDPVKVNAD